jgi:hypothetical protein
MTTPWQVDDRGDSADAPSSPRPPRKARACIPGRDFAPGLAVLGSQVGSRAVGAPWWSCCLLTVLALAAVCLRLVFPQDSPDKLAWWTERWRTKQCSRCQAKSSSDDAGTDDAACNQAAPSRLPRR